MKKRANSALWKYLNEHGINDTHHKDFIFYKNLFYKNYDKNLKQKKRAEKRSFITSFPLLTVQKLRRLAKMSELTLPELIKSLVISEMNKTTLDERIPVYQDILKSIEQCRLSIIRVEEREIKKSIFGNASYDTLYKLLDELINLIQSLILTK